MEPSYQFCPNVACSARGQIGQGNITIHDRKRQRYRCRTCGRTFSFRRGTMFARIAHVNRVGGNCDDLIAFGCPIQAIVQAYGLDERTIASWRDRAGQQCQRVHHALHEQGQLEAVHVQTDEIRVKARGMVIWMGLALMVSSLLWLAGVVSQTRDTHLADWLLLQVRACCRAGSNLLVCTDGWAAYPASIKRAFRNKVKATAGGGRACLRVWSGLCIATVIKNMENKHVVKVTRKMTLGTLESANNLLQASRGGTVLNTTFIERFNATMRERLATLTRRCRHAAHRVYPLETGMYLIGSTYNFCCPHQELSKRRSPRQQKQTPAMASGITDHVWSVLDLLSYKVAPPPWVESKRRGRPRKRPLPDPHLPKRPRGRLHKIH